MTLTTEISGQVDYGVQERGRKYYRRGAVRIVRGDKGSVRAVVHGSRRYHVDLWREGKSVLVSCDCPYYQDDLTPCKHIWATLLAAEAKNYLGSPGLGQPLRLVPNEEG